MEDLKAYSLILTKLEDIYNAKGDYIYAIKGFEEPLKIAKLIGDSELKNTIKIRINQINSYKN
jgi:hypothetical protein